MIECRAGSSISVAVECSTESVYHNLLIHGLGLSHLKVITDEAAINVFWPMCPFRLSLYLKVEELLCHRVMGDTQPYV